MLALHEWQVGCAWLRGVLTSDEQGRVEASVGCMA